MSINCVAFTQTRASSDLFTKVAFKNLLQTNKQTIVSGLRPLISVLNDRMRLKGFYAFASDFLNWIKD